MPSSRQLAAIMFTDIVGYTALMGTDEQKAFDLIKKNRAIHKQLIKQYHGTWIKELGDGVLASFSTVTDAVYCASAIHLACDAVDGLKLRIGIHLGEVVFENNDVFGDGVNIASRLQAIASIGTTWVSESVYKTLVNKKEVTAEFIREETLKNVSEPVKVYAISVRELPAALPNITNGHLKSGVVWKAGGKKIVYFAAAGALGILAAIYFLFLHKQAPNGSLNEQGSEKSIAVLPFVNLSNDKEQEYFSDGLSEELLNLLAKIPGLKVIGRTSSFAFKGKNEDLRTIAEKLGVAHLLEGSVRKDGNKIRVTTQLIKAADGSHLWSETYDRDLNGVFQLQDEIAQTVVQQLKLKLLDIPSAKISGAGNIEAYNLLLQGNYFFDKLDKVNVARAVEFYNKALAIDSTDARAWGCLANAISRQAWQNYIDQRAGYEKGRQAALKAIALDSTLARGYIELGDIKLYHDFDWQGAADAYNNALRLEPSDADALTGLGDYNEVLGHCSEAEEFYRKALIFNPLKPIIYLDLGNVLTCNGRFDDAIHYFRKLLDINPQYQRAHMYIGRNYLLMGKPQMALTEMEKENMENFKIFGLALAYHALDRKKEADEKLKVFIDAYADEWSYLLAELYSFRGEKENALKWLEIAFNKKDSWLYWIKTDALLKNIQEEARYKNILKKLNL